MEITVTALPAKLLVRSPVAQDCYFELRVERDLNSEEWDTLFEYLTILRRPADRKRDAAVVRELRTTQFSDLEPSAPVEREEREP